MNTFTSPLLAALALLLTPVLHAGKPQQLTSPDQVPEGLGKSEWQSIRAAHEGWKHRIHAVEGDWQARNPGQQWTTCFDGRGFVATPKDADWTWGLEFQSYGFGDRQTRVSGTPPVRADGQRIAYQWSNTVEEWFVNDGRGLEHGFTIAERPPGSRENEALSLTLTTRGPLKPTLSSDRQTVHFRDAASAPVLNYSGLKVWDADGTVLPSRFQCAGQELRLLVEETNARYPLTIDPIAQQAYLKAGNNGPPTDNYFGSSVAVSDDTVVVGAPNEDNSANNSGAAYVFTRSGTTWSQQAYLKASNTDTNDYFGWSVAVSGDTVVVGAYQEDSSTTGVNSTPNKNSLLSGAAYVFTRSGTTWSQQAYLKASNTETVDFFGYSVAVTGDTVVVGAYQEDSSATGVNGSQLNNSASNSGAAYVFTRSGTTWSQQAYLKASNTGGTDFFGYSVAASGDTVIVGAYQEDSNTTGVNTVSNNSASNSGAAYVFTRSGTTWSQQAYLKASNTAASDFFGWSVAAAGETVIVGAYGEDSNATSVNGNQLDNSASSSGAAYVFTRSGTTWTQQTYLKASNTGANDQFGYSVSLSGDTVVVGAYVEDSGTIGVDSIPNESALNSGAAYVFTRSETIWSQQAYLKASNTGANDQFGYSVAASGETVIVGARFEDSGTVGVNSTPNETALDSGAVYAFTSNSTSWSQQASMKASNTPVSPFGSGAGDAFGFSVAVSGDTVVVGALSEASSTTGVNSTPNESAGFSGAAYVFTRSGTSWSQQAYLKASNPEWSDFFGHSVAISGDTVVVGAYYEGSSATGVNGNQSNNSAPISGAAYVFTRSGTTWSQQAYLKASNTAADDSFGYSVAVAGDTVVVGAIGEDSNATGVNGNQSNNSANGFGAAYVFTRNGTTWSQQAYLKPSPIGPYTYLEFGCSVAASGDTVVVGSLYEAYVFTRNGTTWTPQASLTTGPPSDTFGLSVAVSGDTLVVGAYGEDSSTTGVNSTPNEDAPSSGAAYVFTRSGTTWSQQAYLKASNTGADDRFGYSVSISGDTVVIGSRWEDSGSTGVNGSQLENSATNSGAAYVFTRSGTTWSQQAYLKASNTGTDDEFGYSVAVSGDVVIVGAYQEDSSTYGVNSTPNEGSSNSGAAYIYAGLGPPPTVTDISPPTGGTGGGTSVTLTGTNFDGATAVLIGGIPAPSFIVVNNTTITATTPAHSPGMVDVEVITPVGSATGGGLFTYLGQEIAVEQPVGNDLISESSTVDYGAVLTNTPASRTFVIRNTGNLPLDGLAASIVGTPLEEFVAVQPAGPVNGGESTTFTVTFTPTALGTRNATLRIASDDDDEDPFEIALTGTGSTALQLFNIYASGADLDGLNAEPNATPFMDGVPNLLKYAFNMNAAGPDTRTLTPGSGTFGLPVAHVGTGTLRYEFLRRKNSGLTYEPLQSSNLSGDWQPATGTETVTSIDETWERVVLEQPLLPGGAEFFSVRVGM